MQAWPPVQFHQPRHSVLAVPPQPDIAGLARNPRVDTQLRHRLFIAFIRKDKSVTSRPITLLVFEAMRTLYDLRPSSQRQEYPRFNLSAMSPSMTAFAPPP
jgi:hypothetical protein